MKLCTVKQSVDNDVLLLKIEQSLMQDLNTYGYWAICRPTGDDVVLRV